MMPGQAVDLPRHAPACDSLVTWFGITPDFGRVTPTRLLTLRGMSSGELLRVGGAGVCDRGVRGRFFLAGVIVGVHGMSRWIILCVDGSLSSDGGVCIGLVFSLVSICLLELCSWHLLRVFIILSLLKLFSRHFCFKHRG